MYICMYYIVSVIGGSYSVYVKIKNMTSHEVCCSFPSLAAGEDNDFDMDHGWACALWHTDLYVVLVPRWRPEYR